MEDLGIYPQDLFFVKDRIVLPQRNYLSLPAYFLFKEEERGVFLRRDLKELTIGQTDKQTIIAFYLKKCILDLFGCWLKIIYNKNKLYGDHSFRGLADHTNREKALNYWKGSKPNLFVK